MKILADDNAVSLIVIKTLMDDLWHIVGTFVFTTVTFLLFVDNDNRINRILY